MFPHTPERLSIELTNRCTKSCAFCCAGSGAEGGAVWTPDEVIGFVASCAAAGTRAVDFGGGEPLEYEGLEAVLDGLRNVVFRSLTTNGLLLDHDGWLERLVDAAPDEVTVSIHYPSDRDEVRRVIRQVRALEDRGLPSHVNLLVRQSTLARTLWTRKLLHGNGIDNSRITYLPMRGRDTPTPEQIKRVAGTDTLRSVSCLHGCGPSPKQCSIGWDRTVALCNYTVARRPLPSLDAEGLLDALHGHRIEFCGDAAPIMPAQRLRARRSIR